MSVAAACHVNVTACAVPVTPVPDNAMLAGEFVALQLMVMLPLYCPVEDGLNVALTVVVCAGLKVIPAALPLAVKPAPDTITFEMVTLEVPAFVRVRFLVLLLETLTFPKLKLVGLAFKSNEELEEVETVDNTTLQTLRVPVELKVPKLFR